MQIHGSCAAREGAGVLLLGPSGSGKSDLVLRLLDRGFRLVADDRVEIEDGRARAVSALAGLIEIRGLGIVRLPFLAESRLALVAMLGLPADGPDGIRLPEDRLPVPARHPTLDLPSVRIDAASPSAPARIALALDCALGLVHQTVGAFAA